VERARGGKRGDDVCASHTDMLPRRFPQYDSRTTAVFGFIANMRLKTSYTAREVAALTGLTARQLQGWDATRVFLPAIAPRRTTLGGFTERRYTPVDVLELLALANLRRRGFAPA